MRRKLTEDRYRVDVAALGFLLVVAASCHVGEDEAQVPEPEPPAGADEHDEPPAAGDDRPSFARRTSDRIDQIREDVQDCCPARDERPPPEVDPSLTETEMVERARALFEEGMHAYRGGEYERAAEAFEAAYAHAPDRHVMAFNIGKAWQRSGDCCRARRALLRFLELVPDETPSESASDILERLECSPCG